MAFKNDMTDRPAAGSDRCGAVDRDSTPQRLGELGRVPCRCSRPAANSGSLAYAMLTLWT
jgi:hypothetical protein